MGHEQAEADAQDRANAAAASQQRNRARITVEIPGGPQDVTEHVVTLLDAITNSLDWGSGFFNREDLVAWRALAQLLNFDADAIEGADQQLQELDRQEQARRESEAKVRERLAGS